MRRLTFGIAALVTLVAKLAAAQVAPTDVWYVTTGDGTPFFSEHVHRESRPDGTMRLVRDTRSLLDLLGQRQETHEKLECVYRAPDDLVSCEVESTSSLAGTTKATVRPEAGQLVIVIEREGTTLERRVSLADKPVLDVFLPDRLAARASETGAVELKLISTHGWRVRGVTARKALRPGQTARWSITYHDGVGDETIDLAADGTIARRELVLPNRTIAPATEAAASELKYLKLSSRELLTFPLREPIPFPERLKSMTVQLSWSGIPIDRLHLEDSHQQLGPFRVSGDSHTVEIRLQPTQLSETSPPLPVKDASFSMYLGEDEFVRPNDPTIRAKASEWAAGATTTLEAARRLTHEVSRYLQGGTLVVDTLSGPEVLACRQGKCSEHSTLLASLTRAVGIPTRIALGVRLVAGKWIGHMWCEAWVGEWIPLDATADEVGGSPALLKLTHSDTVMGTQRARWELTKSLQVDVVSFEKPEGMNRGLTTGIVGQSYTNADYGCRITAPENWTLKDATTAQLPVIEFSLPGAATDRPAMIFAVLPIAPNIGLDLLVASRKTVYQGRKGYREIETKNESVSSHEGRRYVFGLDHPRQADKRLKVTEVFWSSAQGVFLMSLTATEAVHDATLAEFERLLAGFEQL